EWQEKAAPPGRHKEEWGTKERERGGREREPAREEAASTVVAAAAVAAAPNESLGEDFDRTPSGRVRRRSAQVAVFHLQEIAEDELARDWGTKRRIKDDLVPDSKRLNYTRPGLPNFSSELLETWKNEVKEKGFISCSNGGGGEMGKYTCLICQKEFSSESGVKYHISKTHSQKRGRKPKERPPVAEPADAKTPPPPTPPPPPPSSTAPKPMLSTSLDITQTLSHAHGHTPSPTDSGSPLDNRQANGYTAAANKRAKSKRFSLE
ncbi:hypothetical protein CRUP_021698, partial [Coryphaenoides rupestris]